MIEIDGKIISSEILLREFCCDLAACKGECCVDGNSGAPLLEEEKVLLEQEFHNYLSFMKEEGVEAVEEQGFSVLDADGDLTTPLIDGAECAYSIHENGVTLCAIEKAWKSGLTSFRKPLSCHLYPIRVVKFSNGSCGLNYHRWDVCAPAVKYGRTHGIKVYQALKEPLIRAFGEQFYNDLDNARAFLESPENSVDL